GQEGVINATFRTITQEPPGNNYWDDNGQAGAGNDVTAFSQTIDWQALARHQTTPEPDPRGWSDRWYVSSIEPGQGRRTDTNAVYDGKASYLNRVQPFAVYVPKTYDATHPAPLTFLLHSLTQNHNQ